MHECLFCSQTFATAAAKDDHILEHFALEKCTDCDRSLIRIGSSLYTKHDTSTCIKDDLNVAIGQDTDAATCASSVRNNSNLVEDGDSFASLVKSEQHDMLTERPHNLTMQRGDGTYELWTQPHCSAMLMEPEIKIEVEPIEASDEGALCENPIDEHAKKKSCRFCGKNYIQKASLENHIQRVHLSLKFLCQICKKQFDNQHEHDVHQTNCVHKPRKPIGTGAFECEWCASRFHSKAYLRNHILVKHDSSTACYKCTSCYKSFLKESSFQSHNCRYRDSCECNICGRKLKNWGTLKKHRILFHSSASTIFCIVCAKLFVSVDDRDQHQLQCKLKKLMTLSRSGGGHTFECDICQKVMKTKGLLKKHMSVKHHASDEIKLKCNTCGNTFIQELALQNHKCKLRASRSLMPCETCGKVLTRGALSIHQIAFHSPPGTIYCRSCYKVFATVDQLNVHIDQCKTKANNERPSHCNICDKQFASAKALVRHEISQHSAADATGPLCKTCVKRFKTIEELNSHKQECRLKRKLRILKKKNQNLHVETDK